MFLSEYEIVPQWVKDVLECKKEVKKEVQNKLSQKRSIKLDLDGDLLEKFRFDEREKTTFELFTIYINKLLAYLQSLILPKNLVMPCIVGNCDMDKKIKKERELYENLLAKKYGLNPPEKKHEKHEEKRIPDEKNVKGWYLFRSNCKAEGIWGNMEDAYLLKLFLEDVENHLCLHSHLADLLRMIVEHTLVQIHWKVRNFFDYLSLPSTVITLSEYDPLTLS